MKSADVIRVASSYVGQTETPNNSGFKDSVFQKKMEEVGWEKTLAWCSYFAELVFKEAACDAETKKKLGKLFSGSATTTYKNFELDGTYKTGKEPKPGALAIYRHGTGWQGHAAIVVGIPDKTIFKTVEGNTNDVGGREGYIVARKNRYWKKPFTPTGLNLVGFIYLCD
jgi:hypothetical protein